jgi:hypothetical protein
MYYDVSAWQLVCRVCAPSTGMCLPRVDAQLAHLSLLLHDTKMHYHIQGIRKTAFSRWAMSANTAKSPGSV